MLTNECFQPVMKLEREIFNGRYTQLMIQYCQYNLNSNEESTSPQKLEAT